MALEHKIACNGVKPTKSEVCALAAELVELEGMTGFRIAIVEAFKSYDYYDNDNDYDYYDYYNDYYASDYYDYYNDNDYNDYNNHYSIQEKVIALLFLSAMYSS